MKNPQNFFYVPNVNVLHFFDNRVNYLLRIPRDSILFSMLLFSSFGYADDRKTKMDGNLYVDLHEYVPRNENLELHGRVVDSLNTPLQYATVNLLAAVGSNIIQQVKTDKSGKFYFKNAPADSRIEVRMVGYVTVLRPGKTEVGDIILYKELRQLEELIVVGYQSRKASEVTGSVQALTGEKLRSGVSTPNVLSMLKGKASGLYITESVGESGAKGQGVMRGQSSLVTATNNYLGPLIVVDGIITNYQSLQDAVSPADIEDLTILRDAASTAIYGSRAAQGVIVITTKRGQIDKSTIETRVQTGIIQPVRAIRFMNTSELINFMDTDMTRYWQQTASIREIYPEVKDFIRERRTYSDTDRNLNFNWEDAVYSKGNFINNEIGIRSGSKKTKFYTGIGWFKENGVLFKNSFDRKNIRLNIDHEISKKLNARLNVSSTLDKTIRRNDVPDLFTIQPFMVPFDNNGNILDSLTVQKSFNYGPVMTSNTQNLLAESKFDNTHETTLHNHLGSLSLRYEILPSLTLQNSNAITLMNTSKNSYLDPRSFFGKYGGLPDLFDASTPVLPNGSLELGETKFIDFLTSTTINFRKLYNNSHTVTALIGQEWGKRTTEMMDVNMYNLLPGERNMGAAQSFGSPLYLAYNFPYTPKGSVQERATFSVFGQADYNYKGLYMVSGSMRTDATTNFGREKRYGTFYSFSGGWLISKESFFKDIPQINMLRLRASYGTSGRDLGDGYLNQTFYSRDSRYETMNNIGARITQLANPNISWETLYNTNVGIDVGVLNNRINLTADLYHKRSDGLLQQVNLPSAQGSLMQYQNIGEIVNKGLELTVNTHNVKSENFDWHTNFNFSYNKNSITRIYQDSLLDSYSRMYYRKKGDDINSIKAIRFAGINPETGDTQHYNAGLNGEQIIIDGLGQVGNSKNWQNIGSATPRFFGGIINTFRYKNYALSFDWWFQVGNYTQMSLIRDFQFSSGPRSGRNNLVFAENQRVWQGSGHKDANYPDVFSLSDNAWPSVDHRSSRIWGNASHARLRNMRLTFSLPQTIAQILKMSRGDIFLSGDNLYVLKHKDFVGVDPEGAVLGDALTSFDGAGMGMANPRRFTFGLQVTF